jgi:RNA-binding protein
MLTPAERKALKGRAHKLDPVVIIGAKGLTEEVVKEVDLALKAHELIKVRAPGIERGEREEAMRVLCERTQAEAVQTIGKVFVMYRKRDE